VVVIVVTVMIAIMIVVPATLAPYLLEFLMTSVGLRTMFAVAFFRNAKSLLSFMDALFAALIAISACLHG
jgi:hypothetical protein